MEKLRKFNKSDVESKDKTLKKIMSEISTLKTQLPDFQRDWVWTDSNIIKLISSIITGYPIGVAMVLETEENYLDFKSRPIEGIPELNKSPKYLILDGQQRLTSIYSALYNEDPVNTRDDKRKDIKRFYYLNIKKALDRDIELSDAIVSLPEDKIKRGKGNTIKYSLSTSEDEFKHHMFPLNIILNSSKKSDWLRSYERYYNNSMEIQELSDLFRDNITTPVENYKMAIIKLGKNTPSEAVCQIFENVNTNGVQLTVFELLTARFAIEKYELRKDWEERKKKVYNTNLLENIDAVDFLTATTLLISYLNGKPVSGRKKDILNLNLEDYKEYSSLIDEGFKEAENILQEERIYNFEGLPYKAQLIPLAVICAIYKTKNELYRYKSRNKIKKWYWNGVFGELYGRSTESRYSRDVTDMTKWLENDDYEPKTITDSHFYPQRLLNLKTRRNTAYKGIIALILKNNAKDFISGREMNITAFNEENIDVHHIFPKKYCKDNNLPNTKYDSIVNKTPISQKSNKIIGSRSPKDYLKKIIEEGSVPKKKLPKILKEHFINSEYLNNNNFNEFFIERAKLILDSIEEATGKKIPDRDNEVIKEIFGKSLL